MGTGGVDAPERGVAGQREQTELRRTLSGMGWLPRWAYSPVAIGSAFAVVLAALTVGIRVPGLGVLGLFPHGRGFDYGAGAFHGFSPLKREFIDDALGVAVRQPSYDRSGFAPIGSTPSGLSGAERVVDDHPLTNDEASSARAIPSIPYQARTNSSTATRGDDPTECSNVGNTVWYRYTPAREGQLIADTVGTDHGVALGVFTGTAGALSQVAPCNTATYGNALVSFAASARRTYFFQITDLANGGTLVFNLEPKGRIVEESVGSRSVEGNDSSVSPSVSADGRYIAFVSLATNLVPGYSDFTPCEVRQPTNPGNAATNTVYVARACQQIFVRDRRTGRITIASVSSSGAIADGLSGAMDISANGRYVAFMSHADNLVPGDTNGISDIFVHDLKTGRTDRVSVASDGTQARRLTNEADQGAGNFPSVTTNPSISAEGRYVSFESVADGLVAGDTDGVRDVFVHDRLTRTTVRSTGGVMLDGARAESFSACMSPDGRYVAYAFSNEATHLNVNLGNTELAVTDRSSGRSWMIPSPGGLITALAHDSLSVNPRGCFSADNHTMVFASFGDAYLRDMRTGATRNISYGSDGKTTAYGDAPTISANGRYVAQAVFETAPDDQTGGLTGATPKDVIVRDLVTGFAQTVTIGFTSHDATTYRETVHPDISGDGRVIAFELRIEQSSGVAINYLPVRPPCHTVHALPCTYIQVYAYERPELTR